MLQICLTLLSPISQLILFDILGYRPQDVAPVSLRGTDAKRGGAYCHSSLCAGQASVPWGRAMW